MTDQEIIDALVRWLNAKTNALVIQADQSGDEPTGPYVVVRFTGSAPVRDQIQDVEYSGEETVTAAPVIEMEWRYSIHAHGQASPSDLLRPIRSAVELAQIHEPLFPGLIIHELSQIRNVPEYVNEDWEPRAQMDLFIRGLTKDGFQVDVIEEFSLEIGRA